MKSKASLAVASAIALIALTSCGKKSDPVSAAGQADE
jgi:hypothetical protein